MRNKRGKKDKIISIFEILLLLTATFAFAYLIGIATNSITIVSASQDIINCCPETKNGQICQEIPYAKCSEECNQLCSYSRCSEVSECKLGCCIDKQEGNCIPNTPEILCRESNTEWKDDASCNYNECKPGCCIIGDKTIFVNAKKCEILTLLNGLSTITNYDFRQGMTEIECIALEKSTIKGACLFVTDEKTNCKILTKEECIRQTGSYSYFYENYLCTAAELNTTCNPTTNTTCVDGKDEVYFVDSCGNIANIYDSSKIYNPNDNSSIEYWTKIFSKEESCNNNSGNINSASCGNCNYLLGSRCGNYIEGRSPQNAKPNYGNFYCKDLNCYDVPLAINTKGEVLLKGDKKHGEQWCIYETTIGNETQDLIIGYKRERINPFISRDVPIVHKTISGSDPVGSRHYIATCYNGEFSIQPCDEYRDKICIQSDIIINNITNENFSSASCIVNLWQDCLNYNFQINNNVEGQTTNDMMNECLKNEFCYVKQIDIDKYFNFPICLPKYKPAFDLTNREGSSKEICSMASQTCKVIYVKKFSGWKCKANCDCLTKEFTLKMNEFCRSLGDCGAQINVAGEVTTSSFKVSRAPPITAQDIKNLNYSNLLNIEIGEYASIENLSYIINRMNIPPEMLESEKLFSSSFLGSIIGGTGILYAISLHNLAGTGATLSQIFELAFTGVTTVKEAIFSLPFLSKLSSLLAGFSIGYMLSKFFGLSEGAAIAIGVIGAVVAFYGITQGWFSITTLGFIGLTIIILSFLFGIGKKKVVQVTSTCSPYQVPIGGENCDFCNKNEYLPCNRYKCTSLGTACKFINEGTPQEKCIASINDHTAPIISPLKFDNYTYNELQNGYEIKTKNNECFEAWQDILLGITTNEVSQCKISLNPGSSPTYFDNIPEYFPNTIYQENHTLLYKLPSADLLGAIGFSPTRTGTINFYIRCQDDWGNKNTVDYIIKTCVKPEPDKTPPIINKFSPEEENAYLGFEKNNFSLTIFTNEPAECKYSFINKNYDEMEYNFSCSSNKILSPEELFSSINETEDETEVEINFSEISYTKEDILNSYLSMQTIFGFPCYAEINTKDNYTIFIKCKDQPWYEEENESLRNVNLQPQPLNGYTIKKSLSQLNIDSILPKGEILAGTSPFTIELIATTSGGVDGKATCYYSFNGKDFSMFYETGSTKHKQTFNQIIEGDYTIYVKCIDKAGNIALNSTTFYLQTDTKAPKVIRTYSSLGILTIITDEESYCSYSASNCNFMYENGTSMENYGKIHTTPVQYGKTYYIKCKDIYGNLPSQCSIIIRNI
ncbi:MAG: hypothetical protein QW117_01805 [Candidatus Pacearchaeota archaeon]